MGGQNIILWVALKSTVGRGLVAPLVLWECRKLKEEVSVTGPSGGNLSEGEVWSSVTEDDTVLSLALDGSDGGLWSGNFVPPPPRPLFLDDTATPDGLTTCDLCSWAWQSGNSLTLDAAMVPGELGWVLTLVIVSVISAVIGAVVMIIVLHCKRVQNTRESGNRDRTSHRTNSSTRNGTRPPISTPDDKEISTITQSAFPSPASPHAIANNGVWSWLSCRTTPVPSQLDSPTSPAENHYTHMDEALYAELDQESNVDSNSPAYQNSAYTDPDAPSAPSSAYYSDLSVTTVPDRAYEVVGLSTLPIWDSGSSGDRRQPPRLASISETVSVPSDYV